MSEPKYTLKEFRSALKAVGARVRTKRYCDFIGASVFAADGKNVSESQYFSNQSQVQEFRDKYKDVLDIIEKYKRHTWNDLMRVVIC